MLKNALMFFILLLQTSTLLAEKTIVLTTGEWEPYTSQSHKNHGLVNVIVKEAFKLQNINVEYKFYPWKRAMLYVKNGKYEGSTAWAKTEQRKKDFIFSKKQIFLDKTVFIHLKNLKFNWRGNIVELQKFKLGTSLGYAYSTELENAFKNNLLKPDIGIDDLKSLRKLMLKRIDIFICGKDAALTLVRKYFSKKELQQFTKYIITPYKEIPIHLLLNKNQTKLKEEFDIGFKKLKESGRYQELITQIKKGEDYVN